MKDYLSNLLFLDFLTSLKQDYLTQEHSVVFGVSVGPLQSLPVVMASFGDRARATLGCRKRTTEKGSTFYIY